MNKVSFQRQIKMERIQDPETDCPQSVCQALREFLESCQSSVCIGILKQQGLTPGKECPNNRIDEFACQSESKRAKSKSFLFSCPFMWVVIRRCGPDLGWVFPPQMILSRKFPSDCPEFQLIIDVAKLTTKNSHHASKLVEALANLLD